MLALRFALPTLALLAGCCLNACSSGKLADGGPDDGPGAPQGQLVLQGPAELSVLPSGMVPLSVRYLNDNDVGYPGVTVQFAFVDPAPGSSLVPAAPITDETGVASTTLRVGSEFPRGSSFQVRVSVEGLEPLLIKVTVGDVVLSPVSVEVAYQGGRQVATRSVTVLPSTDCAAALAAGVTGETTYTFADASHLAKFDLGPGLNYAIVAWGHDSTNAKVAEGCKQTVTTDYEGEGASLSVELFDTPMELDGSYQLEMDLDVSVSLARVAAAMQSAAVASVGAAANAQGNYYLDAVEEQLTVQGNASAAAALAMARADGVLAASIEAALDEGAQGPLAYVQALAGASQTAGNLLEIRSTYGISAVDVPMTLDIAMVRARSADKIQTLELSQAPGYVAPSAAIDAAYSDRLGALEIATLSVQLGLGTYAKLLLASLVARDDLHPVAEAGCDLLAQAIMADAALAAECDAACVEAACGRALSRLRDQAVVSFPALDNEHGTIGVRGRVYAHDREGDGHAEELGPADLEGNWGKAKNESKPDAVTGKVPAPTPAPAPAPP